MQRSAPFEVQVCFGRPCCAVRLQKAINILQNIMGIGPASANELVTKFNIKTIAQLKKAYEENKIKLTHEQILGIKYHKHLPYNFL